MNTSFPATPRRGSSTPSIAKDVMAPRPTPAQVDCRVSTGAAARVPPDAQEQAGLEGARLAARTAHELLNRPLTLAVGYTDLLGAAPELPDSLRPLVDEVLRSMMQVSTLLEHLLAVVRLEQVDLGRPDGPLLNLARSTESPRV